MRALIAIALLLSVAGCGSEPTGLAAEAAGTYTLVTVDGSPPPFVYIEAPGYRDVILGGVVTLASDGTFTDATTMRVTREAVTEEKAFIVRGSWAMDGYVVVFTPNARLGGGGSYTMTFRDGRLTLVEAGVTSVFERQPSP
jgi:hypothetical protein